MLYNCNTKDNAHSVIVCAVSDDARHMYVAGGNTGSPISNW